ncbi:MAG: H(+)/Cl(-) exchange transporter ClcA [Caldilineaceae bacterium]
MSEHNREEANDSFRLVENAATDLKSEVREFLDVSQRRRRLLPRAALVGLVSGVMAVVFRSLLALADYARNGLLEWAHQFPTWGWIFPILFSATGAVLAVALVRNFAPETSGSGIPHLKAVMLRFRELDWKRVIPIKMLSGVLALGSGMALGREGPTVQMGGAVGDAVSRLLKVSTRERLTLTAAGAGSGLAAAFNAPLSGLVFVLEEIQRDFRRGVFGAAFIACAVATIITRFVSGQLPVFTVPTFPTPPLTVLPFMALLGISAGLLGVTFNKGILVTLNLLAPWLKRHALWVAAAVGAIVGVAAWISPLAVGSGHTLAEEVLTGNMALAMIPLWFIVRYGLTLISYGTGSAGGIFAPMLALGALNGLAVGELAHLIAPVAVGQPAVFAVVGMATYFAAVVRTPLTGIVLIIEMTGDYELMLALLVSSFCAYIVAEALGDLPIYEALLERDLLRSGIPSRFEDPVIAEFEVAPGAPFAGRQIRDLGLPAGCIIVRCMDGEHEWVPHAKSVLEPHTRLTAVIAPEAKDGFAALHHGCEAG